MGTDTSGKNCYRKTGESTWYYRFQVGGKAFHGPAHTTDKREAEAFAARHRREEKERVRLAKLAAAVPKPPAMPAPFDEFERALDELARWMDKRFRALERRLSELEGRLTRPHD